MRGAHLRRSIRHRVAGVVAAIVVAAVRPPWPMAPLQAAQDGQHPGRAVIQNNRCLACHRLDQEGSRVGPDLSDVGARRTPAYIRRAIEAPDADVAPDQRHVRVTTRTGASIQGRLMNQDAFIIQMIGPDERLRSFQRSQLRDHAIVSMGLMPSFATTLTEEQLWDVVTYLAARKGTAR